VRSVPAKRSRPPLEGNAEEEDEPLKARAKKGEKAAGALEDEVAPRHFQPLNPKP
jgi:hypothetical protein